MWHEGRGLDEAKRGNGIYTTQTTHKHEQEQKQSHPSSPFLIILHKIRASQNASDAHMVSLHLRTLTANLSCKEYFTHDCV